MISVSGVQTTTPFEKHRNIPKAAPETFRIMGPRGTGRTVPDLNSTLRTGRLEEVCSTSATLTIRPPEEKVPQSVCIYIGLDWFDMDRRYMDFLCVSLVTCSLKQLQEHHVESVLR